MFPFYTHWKKSEFSNDFRVDKMEKFGQKWFNVPHRIIFRTLPKIYDGGQWKISNAQKA